MCQKQMRDLTSDGGERRSPQGPLDMKSNSWDFTPDRYNPVSTLPCIFTF